jgi:hypothetical protein
MKSIAAAAASEGQGYAAVKVRAAHQKGRHVDFVHCCLGPGWCAHPHWDPRTILITSLPCLQVTALGQPKLLERVSDSLNAVHNLFRRFDEDLNGVVTRDEFEKVGSALALTAPHCPASDVSLVRQTYLPGTRTMQRCNTAMGHAGVWGALLRCNARATAGDLHVPGERGLRYLRSYACLLPASSTPVTDHAHVCAHLDSHNLHVSSSTCVPQTTAGGRAWWTTCRGASA